MKIILMSFVLTIMLFCCPFVNAQDNLTADDIKFLKSCNIEQSDIDVIPKLPPDGKEKIELVLESHKKNCNMPILREFKATREFLRKFTPPPETCPMPPVNYDNNFLTKEETDYINNVDKKILDKTFENFNKNTK
jgi:hypothetical protein